MAALSAARIARFAVQPGQPVQPESRFLPPCCDGHELSTTLNFDRPGCLRGCVPRRCPQVFLWLLVLASYRQYLSGKARHAQLVSGVAAGLEGSSSAVVVMKNEEGEDVQQEAGEEQSVRVPDSLQGHVVQGG